jgi:DnaJ-class molecular chaperone
MRPHNNPWDILGVHVSASYDEVKQAYRRLAMKYHPDKGGNIEMFNLIHSAYENIKNRNPVPVLSQPDITMITLKLSIRQQIEGLNDYVSVVDPKTKKELLLKVKIPPGARHEDKIKINYKGRQYIINILEKRDPVFTRQGFNIIMEKQIDIVDAMRGSQIQIHDACDESHTITIPPGTQHNAMFAIPQKGLYNKKTKLRGNLYVFVDFEIPELNLHNLEEFILRLKNDRN